MRHHLTQDLPDHLGLTRCRHGLMLYLKRDRYIGGSLATYGEFSEAEHDLFRQILRPGDAVVEAGANIGAHTVGLSQLVGPAGVVYAFEPQRIIFQLLCANLALNGIANVHAVQSGLGSAGATAYIPPLDYGRVGNFGGISLVEGQGEPVRIDRLDALSLDRLRLLKIDVEGMEREVLAGATETLQRLRPILYVENDRQANSPALIRHILDAGYRLWWHLPQLYEPANFFGVAENIFGPIVSINMVGVPREMPIQIDMREITSETDNWREG